MISSSSAFDSEIFLSPSRTDSARIYSSNPGAEQTPTKWIYSLPILVMEIQVLAGINTVAPLCTSLEEPARFTRAVPFCKKRISSASGCLCISILPPGSRSSVGLFLNPYNAHLTLVSSLRINDCGQ